MSLSSDRGKAFERVVQKITRRGLKLDIKRDLQSGAGIHKQDIRDRYDQMPIFIECKDHQTIKPKEWWREANSKAVAGQAAVVVFPDNEEVLCVMRYSDLLSLIKEGFDWREAAEQLRVPKRPALQLDKVTEKAVKNGARICPNGHIVDNYGYCQAKGCPYSRGFKNKKKGKA